MRGPMSAQNTLRGRDAECTALDVLLDAARRGESRTVVLRGEPGVGKTALLDYAIGSAQDFASCEPSVSSPRWSSRSLLFISSVLRSSTGADASRIRRERPWTVAFGLSSGPAPDRFLVGLAALGLFAETAEERPLLCVIDDAQWLDQASALAFALVARRLLAEPIDLVFAVREPVGVRELAGLPELKVGGLGEDDARALLDSHLPGRLDERVRDRIVAESRGNPLALLELPRGLSPAELAGGFALPDARALADRIERSFLRQVRSLPPDTQQLLLTAAAEPFGDVSLLWRAADRLGLGPERLRRRRLRDWSSSAPWCGSVIRWCARRSTGRHPCPTGKRRIGRSPSRSMPTSTPIAGHGTVRSRRRAPTRTSPWNSSVGGSSAGSRRRRGGGRVP